VVGSPQFIEDGSTPQDLIVGGGGRVLVGGKLVAVAVGGTAVGLGVLVGGTGVEARVFVGRGVWVGMKGIGVSVGVELGISVYVIEGVNVGIGVSVG
jgi:hypothetical protein